MNLPFLKNLFAKKTTPKIDLRDFSYGLYDRELQVVPEVNNGIMALLSRHGVEIAVVLVLLFSVTLISISSASTRTDLPINYQGRLTSSSGVPVTDTSRDFRFAIYSASSGGSCLWATGPASGSANCSSIGSVALPVSSGLFNVALGNGGTNNPEIDLNFNSGVFYLEVRVDNESPLGTFETFTPRKQLGSTPYAYNSDLLDGINSAGFAILTGQAGGQTLIGGTGATDNFVLQSTSANGNAANGILFKVGNNGATTAMTILNNGNVGVGVTPTEKLSVAAGGNVLQTAGNPVSVGSISTGLNAPYSSFISGRYAYVVSFTNNTLAIFDVSNPASPTSVGSTTTGLSNPYGVYVAGRYAYVTSEGNNTLAIFDVSNPASPTSVGSTTTGLSTPQAIQVVGKYAFVASRGNSTMVAFDISNPASPTNVGSVAVGGNTYSLYVSGNYAYTTSYSANSLTVFNVTNPASMTSVGTTTTGLSGPISVFVSGRYAYVASNTSGTLSVFDVKNPASPTSVGTTTTGLTTPRSVFVSGRYAYVASTGTNTLVVFDVSNPASPTNIGSAAVGTSPFSVFVSGRYAFTTSTGAQTLNVFDISGIETTSVMAHSLEAGSLQVRNSANIYNQLTIGSSLNVGIGGINSNGPISLTGRSTGTTTSTLDVRNSAGTSLLYVRDDGKIGINTTTPTELLTVASGNITQTPGNPISIATASTGVTPFSIYAAGRYVYVANYGANNFQVFDVSNPASPTSIATTSTDTSPRGIVTAGNYAYVVNNSSNTFQIFDISRPNAPTSVSSTSVSGTGPWSLYVSGRYAYVTVNDSNTLKVFDISNPASPTIIGSVSTGTNPRGVYVLGKYAYVVNTSSNTIQVFDVSNPASPTLTGSASTDTGPSSIHVVGRYAYVTNSTTGTLQIFNIANPASPVSISATAAGVNPYGVYATGKYVYVSNSGSNSLSVFNVTNPASPVNTGIATTTGAPYGLFVAGKYAYTANGGNDTFQIFDVSGLESTSVIAHSLEAGSLQVRDSAMIGNQLSIGSSLAVGLGGIQSQGPVSIIARSTGTITSALDIRNSAGTSLLYVRDDGRIGINTTSPGSELDIKGTLRLSGSSSGYVGLAPAAAAGSTTYTLPSADGTSGQVLSTNGSGILSWATAGGGGGSSSHTITPTRGDMSDIGVSTDYQRIITDGTSVWTLKNNSIYKVNLTTGATVNSSAFSDSVVAMIPESNFSTIYVILNTGSNYVVHKVDPSTLASTANSTGTVTNYLGTATTNWTTTENYIVAGVNSGGNTLGTTRFYWFNKSTLALTQTTVTFPTDGDASDVQISSVAGYRTNVYVGISRSVGYPTLTSIQRDILQIAELGTTQSTFRTSNLMVSSNYARDKMFIYGIPTLVNTSGTISYGTAELIENIASSDVSTNFQGFNGTILYINGFFTSINSTSGTPKTILVFDKSTSRTNWQGRKVATVKVSTVETSALVGVESEAAYISAMTTGESSTYWNVSTGEQTASIYGSGFYKTSF